MMPKAKGSLARHGAITRIISESKEFPWHLHRCSCAASSFGCLCCLDEIIGLDTRLLEDAVQGVCLDLTVQRHDASLLTASQEHMATALPDDDKSEPLQYAHAFGAGDAWQLRHW
jgi:hypothetical protein